MKKIIFIFIISFLLFCNSYEGLKMEFVGFREILKTRKYWSFACEPYCTLSVYEFKFKIIKSRKLEYLEGQIIIERHRLNYKDIDILNKFENRIGEMFLIRNHEPCLVNYL